MKKVVLIITALLWAQILYGQTMFYTIPLDSMVKWNIQTNTSQTIYRDLNWPMSFLIATGPDGRIYFARYDKGYQNTAISRMRQDGSQVENIVVKPLIGSGARFAKLFFLGPDLYFSDYASETNLSPTIFKIADVASISYGQKFFEPTLFLSDISSNVVNQCSHKINLGNDLSFFN